MNLPPPLPPQDLKVCTFRTCWRVLKPRTIIVFFVVWNGILIPSSILPVAGIRPFKAMPAGVVVASAFALYWTIAPVVSMRHRRRWCRQDWSFGSARAGLIFVATVAAAGMIVGTISFLSRSVSLDAPIAEQLPAGDVPKAAPEE